MKRLIVGRHPSLEALSAYVDADEVPGAGTRIDKHLARCADCRAELEEIRALGDAARAMEWGAAPADLWARIEAAAAAPPVAIAGADTDREREIRSAIEHGDVVRDHETVSIGRSVRSPAIVRSVSLALGLVLAATLVLGWPNRATLNATGTSRLTFSPSRPVPNGTLIIHYRAPAWLQGAPRLVLAGQFARAHRASQPAFWGPRRELDSLATLLPTTDGSYEARLRLPPHFLGLRLVVFDSLGETRDAGPSGAWIVIGGNADGTPSLAAFLAMYEPVWRDQDGRVASAGHVFVADSIQRYFPGHPAGWSLYDRFGAKRGVFDFLSFFESAERKYASLDDALWPRRTLDAEQEIAMWQLASKIEEPVEQTKWAMRFVRDHPDDQRALDVFGDVLHQMELRDAPHVADSIRLRLPLLDSLYWRSHAQPLDGETYSYGNPIGLVQRYGDSATKAMWAARPVTAASYYTIQALPTALDSSTESRVIAELHRGCARRAGKFPMQDRTTWQSWCAIDRSLTWSRLSRAHFDRHDLRSALAFGDSAVAATASMRCGSLSAANGARAAARLALGDTLGARGDFLAEYGRGQLDSVARDRIERALGARFDAATFDAAADSIHRAGVDCFRRGQRELRARDSARARERTL